MGATKSSYSGICLSSCSNCIIENNKLLNNSYGIYVLRSKGNQISKNTATNDGEYGIVLGTATDNTLSGNTAFKLHDTYGFPVDLIQDILKDKNIAVDMDGFEKLMSVQKQKARESWAGSGEDKVQDIWFRIKEQYGISEFVGYTDIIAKGKVISLVQNNKEISSINNDKEF